MLFVSFTVGLLILFLTRDTGVPNALLLAGMGALAGTVTELVSPSEYDTVTVPLAILAVMLVLEAV